MKRDNHNTSDIRLYRFRRRAVSTVSAVALASAVTLSLSALSAGPALAQDNNVLETITVTAQFRKQNLQQTPIAITAINSEMMDARSQTSINQVAAQAPSVTLSPRGGAYGPSMAVYIRGVGQADFNPAFEPGVGIYIDDVYFPTLTGSIMDLLDLDRVEILRGPQGTLAGRNSIGGAIKLYSKEPAGDNTGYVSATYGSRNRLDLRASADFAVTDNLFARLSGVSKKQEGYVERRDYGCLYPDSGFPRIMSSNTDCVLAREGQINYQGVRGILRWDNKGPVTVTVIGDYTDDNRITTPSVLIAAKGLDEYVPNADVDPWGTGLGLDAFVPPPGSYYNYGTYSMVETANRPSRTVPGRSYFRSWGVSGKIDWDLGNMMNLESITAYRDYKSGFQNDNDLSPLNQQLGDGTSPLWAFSQELRLNGSFADDMVEWTIGGFYMKQRSWYPSYQDLRYSPLPAFQQNDPINAKSKAAFAHVSWNATDKLTVIGGLRYTDESKSYKFSRKTPDGDVLAFLADLDGKVGDYAADKVDWRAGVQYQWNDAIMTYAQVATGFKGGGINPRPFFGVQAYPFNPESLTSYEIGAKTELLDRRLRLNAAAFLSKYKDIQTGAVTCPPGFIPPGAPPICSLILNAGKADVKGFELEADFQPVEGLQMDGSLSYLDFSYTSVSALAQGGAIKVGNTSPFTPEWKWSYGVQYKAYLTNNQSLTPRFDISYTSKVYTGSSNLERSAIDGYALANARLTYRDEDKGWEAALEVTNVFDKYYFRSIYDAYDRAGIISGSPGHPREWALTVKKSF